MTTIQGTVIRGEGIGEQQGFPTANLSRHSLRHKRLTRGVYIATAYVKARALPALVIIGVPGVKRFTQGKVEVYIIDRDTRTPLYGEHVRAKIHTKIRPLYQYRDTDRLLKRIQQDINQAKQYFRARPTLLTD